MSFDWASDLQVSDAEAPVKAAPRTPGAGRERLTLPDSITSRLAYVDENEWFAVPNVPSAVAANALIYQIRQYVKGNGNGLSILVDAPAGTKVSELLDRARFEKAGTRQAEPYTLRFHVKKTARAGVGRKPAEAV